MNPDNIIVLGKRDAITERSFLVTRSGSILGNKFITGRDGTRDEVIEKYRIWLDQEILAKSEVYDRLMQLVELYKAGKQVRIRCVCKPKSCHADMIKLAIIRLASTVPTLEIDEL